MSNFRFVLHWGRLRGIGLTAIPLLTAIALVATPFQVAASDVGNPDAGHEIAQKWCSDCHVVDHEQRRATSTGAPTFAAIAGMKTTTPLGLHAFLQTPHHRMPDLHLSQEEGDDLVAYIMSLRTPDQ
jgi:mono/diheme cytochrome c family protein